MKSKELLFTYPDGLIAQVPQTEFRTLLKEWGHPPQELSRPELFHLLQPGDLLVINNSKVEPRRIFAKSHASQKEPDVEVLFVKTFPDEEGLKWEVLFPAKNVALGQKIFLPNDRVMELQAKGLPQLVGLNKPIDTNYFMKFGEPALPPYIQKARGERHCRSMDYEWYQTQWALSCGSAAAPTASLHFTVEDLQVWRNRGVKILPLTLHVGLGTFLPVKTENLLDHKIHSEWVQIPQTTLIAIKETLRSGGRVWALGTTVVRSLESWAHGLLSQDFAGNASGSTALFITPGFDFRVVSGLLTNFHQPGSTLFALVAAFAGSEAATGILSAKETYQWAMERHFRLFSYGDLSIWTRAKKQFDQNKMEHF
ncbi:MAG: S-adenosylmethionine:tRNA ribosyltransferase-isomerase [Bdellovibrionales bacterium]|nr:S-adenosylmethionine:tRNA ribosyltransferase-isomerase [Bdellovibrionales bacterium]